MYWDQISGEALDTELVRESERVEEHDVDAHQVYKIVPTEQCWARTGVGPTPTGMVYVNKGDRVHP